MADIGSTLREARMRARIDISEVETRTKIRAKYLRAIENEEWDLLPGPVYVKSFLRTYGDYLGLDSRMLIDDYKRRYERPSDGELRPIASLSRERERAARGPLLPPWAIIAAVIVAVGVVLYIVGSGSGTNKPLTPVTGLHNKPSHHAATHAPASPATHKAVPAAPTTVRLQLTPTSAVYVCVDDGRGKVLIPGVTYSPGQKIPIERASKLLVTLGNNSVDMKVNGKRTTVPPSTTAINFELTPSGQHPLPAGHLPTCT
jgi:hypothetical protein